MADAEGDALGDHGFGGTTIPRFTALYFETELTDSDDGGVTAHGNDDFGKLRVGKSTAGVSSSGDAGAAQRAAAAAAAEVVLGLEAHELASHVELEAFAAAAKRLVDSRRAADKVIWRTVCVLFRRAISPSIDRNPRSEGWKC